MPCASFNGLDGVKGDLKDFMILVEMGDVKDFFMPVKGASLCEMLVSQDKHMWSSLGLPPSDEQLSVLGSFKAMEAVLGTRFGDDDNNDEDNSDSDDGKSSLLCATQH